MNNEDVSPQDGVEENSGPQPQPTVIPPELLADIPEEERDEFSRKLASFGIQITREEHYFGPLQPSKEAARWNELVPGSAERSFNLYEQQALKKMEANDRILTTLEQTTRHDINLERQQHDEFVALTKTKLKNNADRISRGQWFAFIAFIFISLGGFYMVHSGHDALGIAVLVFEAVGVAGVFLHQMRSDQGRPSRSEV